MIVHEKQMQDLLAVGKCEAAYSQDISALCTRNRPLQLLSLLVSPVPTGCKSVSMQSNLAEDEITAWVLHDDACRLFVILAQRLIGDFRMVKVIQG